MDFTDAVANGFVNFVRFRGRATLRELGFWLLAAAGALVGSVLIDVALVAPAMGFAPFAAEAGRPLTVLVSLVLLAPTLAVMGRRLHDTGRSARWLWLLVVPVVGLLALVWMLTRPGQGDVNRWGEPVVGLYRT